MPRGDSRSQVPGKGRAGGARASKSTGRRPRQAPPTSRVAATAKTPAARSGTTSAKKRLAQTDAKKPAAADRTATAAAVKGRASVRPKKGKAASGSERADAKRSVSTNARPGTTTRTKRAAAPADRPRGTGAAVAPMAQHAPAAIAAPPRYSVVCISRSHGSLGDAIGRDVAANLGLRFADDEIIVRAAEQAGVLPEVVESAEHRPRLVARILKAMARAPLLSELPVPLPAPVAGRSAGYERLIESVIHAAADEGNIVIVAHGGSIALRGRPHTLRVLVTASPAVRAERVASESGLALVKAEKAIQRSDDERRDYLRRFYGVQQEQPTHYDMVVNTDRLTSAEAAQLIVSAARSTH